MKNYLASVVIQLIRLLIIISFFQPIFIFAWIWAVSGFWSAEFALPPMVTTLICLAISSGVLRMWIAESGMGLVGWGHIVLSILQIGLLIFAWVSGDSSKLQSATLVYFVATLIQVGVWGGMQLFPNGLARSRSSK